MSIAAALFWIATLVVAWVYVGYPALAGVMGRLRPFRPSLVPVGSPLVTVGIAAHDEARELEARVANVLDQEGSFRLEVLVASDGSTDGSVSVLERLATRDPRVRFLALDRVGQTGAQDEIFRAAKGEIVVLSDAATRFAPGCIANLVAPFADRRVGCTTGRLAWLDLDLTGTSRNEGLYWRYEQLVRGLESRAGWLTAVTGAILAVRRDLYRPVPIQASMDHLLPLYARDQGLVVLAVATAVATDRPISGLRAQLRNRTRTATRGIRANLSMAGRLTPWRRPSACLAIWSHKLLRWATPLLAGVALAAAAWLVLDGSAAFLVPIAIAGVVAVLGVAAVVLRRLGQTPRWASLPLAVLVVNAAFLAGWANVIRGRSIGAWHRTDWTPLQANTTDPDRRG
jgi:cellulose synthase/poly-beta-1,6-N-acetylglucosamine synthase-like glycosyltransferase